MSQQHSGTQWGSRFGFILASAGSAIGLGAIWKFPYWAGTYGGANFIIPFILFTFTIGLRCFWENSQSAAPAAAAP